MNDIKFSKDDLLTAIKTNLNAHRSEFETAIAGYEAEALKRTKDLVKQLKNGERPNLTIHLAIPMDHTKDYERIIRMLEMSQESVVVLDEHDFAQYVQDDWAWKNQFHLTNSSYMSAGSAALAKRK